MVLYVTYNDAPSGIYNSQVIDVLNCWQRQFAIPTQLIAFVSLRRYKEYKQYIKAELPNALVLPMFPSVQLWKWNALTLFFVTLYYQPKTIVGRSVYATNIALIMRAIFSKIKIVYDGRGAIAAEVAEYNVGNGSIDIKAIETMERKAIIESNYKLAVSNALVNYWQTEYNYTATNHVVVPCTVDDTFMKTELTTNSNTTINVVYAGSLAGWQSLQLLHKLLINILQNNNSTVITFLSDEHELITQLQMQFPKRITQHKVPHKTVCNALMQADYGILFREISITNSVASPVKFGEYLACGLQIIASANIGDCSEQVLENNLGIIITDIDAPIYLSKPTAAQRTTNRTFALAQYNKNTPAVLTYYKTLLTL
ncbi:MAG: hypothetical protein H7331_08320 [Bacteroidia bacterium]|nr:hypothetical protein [Bacteroidia bacterium]